MTYTRQKQFRQAICLETFRKSIIISALRCKLLTVTACFILLPSMVKGQCSVCGPGKEVGNPDAVFEFPGQPAVSCFILQQAGEQGLIPLGQCVFLPTLLEVCDCQNTKEPTPAAFPTPSPTTLPTPEPSPKSSKMPTHAPSFNPTTQNPVLTSKPSSDEPTQSPTSKPSRKPTMNPISAPLISPTEEPIDSETFSPTGSTEEPSGMPSSSPSYIPSMSSSVPTLEPSQSPTLQNSLFPSSNPSQSPTLRNSPYPSSNPSNELSGIESIEPSGIESIEPSSKESLLPSLLASGLPSLKPSAQLTLAPSVTLTNVPSFLPSEKPSELKSDSPTQKDSLLPSISPSSLPSFIPSENPSVTHYPSIKPSNFPSGTPSFRPSRQPTIGPSVKPSMTPSTNPSLMPSLELQLYAVELSMEFNGLTRILSGQAQIAYNAATAEHIKQEFRDSTLKLQDFFVGVVIKKQELFDPSSSGAIINGDRTLQEQQKSVLKIVCDTSIEFRSENKTDQIDLIVGGAFNKEDERKVYIEELKKKTRGSRDFMDITGLGVQVNGNMILVEKPAIVPNEGKSSNLVAIVGGIVGGIAIVVGLFLLLRHKRFPKEDITFATTKVTPPGERLNTDILVEPQDEISTLGDPMYGAGMLIPGLEKDETVTPSIVSGDYEYSRNYRTNAAVAGRERADTLQSSLGSSLKDSAADLSSFGALGKMEGSIFSDDASFERQFTEIEERFEVVAPAGKLGMVIDTPSGGMPVVHAIKDTSILADRVMVGDRLISVDDEDTTGFTAMQVSRLKVKKPIKNQEL
eukprot:CAMPEP_0194139104 /NCGR_PEP_ID=MMETSP0152-20130528/8843_1 /TAXON_ID=1049557 /ORGANISM="Thalassiothrix antarctica, Strain L6-D1" /LENGTH=797 /DNA_ID=CAMNT_0038836853 /DNA_START=119 /DNA_END=2513 /DNA_ORIENTATION=+